MAGGGVRLTGDIRAAAELTGHRQIAGGSGRLIGERAAPVAGDRDDLLVGDKHALHTERCGGVGRLVEHVTASQQLFRAGLVEDDARVHRRGHGERDTRREVGFDQAR